MLTHDFQRILKLVLRLKVELDVYCIHVEEKCGIKKSSIFVGHRYQTMVNQWTSSRHAMHSCESCDDLNKIYYSRRRRRRKRRRRKIIVDFILFFYMEICWLQISKPCLNDDTHFLHHHFEIINNENNNDETLNTPK